jgi:kanamycin nucleotidyltransferase
MTTPQAHTHDERIERALEIETRLKSFYGDRLVALGIYGSVARSTDGPFSDLEMLCVIQGKGVDATHEWCTGAWKTEVNVFSPDTFLAQAEELDGNWPISHGALTAVLPLYDPTHFFWGLQTVVFGHPQEAFDRAIRGLIVEDILELVGKISNARSCAHFDSLALYAVVLARHAACLVGLANQKVYTSASVMFRESLLLTDRPAGYDEFCALVIAGQLSEPERILAAAQTLWDGITAWAAGRGIKIVSSLEEQLGA